LLKNFSPVTSLHYCLACMTNPQDPDRRPKLVWHIR